MSHRIGAIVLAAGFSNRFGGIKLSARLDNGHSVFSQTMQHINAALDQVLVVTRPELVAELSPHCDKLAIFEAAEKGMGATLAFAVHLARDWDGCLICLADMPFVASNTYVRIARQLTPERIILPCYNSQAGNPVGFGSSFFPELLQLQGDAGGRPLLQRHQHAVVSLELEDAAILDDIDTPEDLQRLQLTRS